MKIDYNTGTTLAYNVGIKGEMIMNGQVARDIEMMPATKLEVESRYDGALSKDYLQLLPKIALQYNLSNRRGNLYASISKGYRSGGYNIQLFSDLLQSSLRNDMMRLTKETMLDKVPDSYASMVGNFFPDASANPDEKHAIEFKPEVTWNYEVGTHLNLWNGRLQLDGALFLMETENQQISRMLLSGLGRETINAGKSRSMGMEVAANVALSKALQVNAAYGYTYATFRYWELGNKVDSSEMAIDYTGNYVPFVPKHTLNIGAQYALEFARKQLIDRIVFSANYAGAGRIYWDEANSMSQTFYGTLNGRVSLQHKDCEVSFWVRNALDKEYATFYFTSMNNGLKQLGRPVHGGIEIRLKL
jgi:outer membrane receptor protein involved in Fe transport